MALAFEALQSKIHDQSFIVRYGSRVEFSTPIHNLSLTASR